MGAAMTLFGSAILTGLKVTLGTVVHGATIQQKVESDPFSYISNTKSAPVYPAIVIEPKEWPRVDYDNGEAETVTQLYTGSVFYINNVALSTIASVYASVRDDVMVLAQRVANTQTLNVANPMADGTSFVKYVRMTGVDLRPPEHRWVQEQGLDKVVGAFDFEVEVVGPQPGTKNYATE